MSNIDLFNELIENSKSTENVCYSGGASGSDRFFGIWSTESNHELLHFGFKNHSYKGHSPLYNVIVPDELLHSDVVLQSLHKANLTLNRRVPDAGYVLNLLSRNYFQIKNTERVYCVVENVYTNTVSGGTGWAVQMYIDYCKDNNIDAEIWAYSTVNNKAYTFLSKENKFVNVNTVPIPKGKWTGIGSRTCTIQQFKSFVSIFK